jgi:hypothetical protein
MDAQVFVLTLEASGEVTPAPEVKVDALPEGEESTDG